MVYSQFQDGQSGPAFDVAVIGASAGGMAATYKVFRQLPPDFALPILLMLHLPPKSRTVDFYGRLGFTFEWVQSGSVLAARKVLVCAPRTFVELLPDGSCSVAPCPGGALERPIDRLFESAARSFGQRAIGVILTGMGQDGAAGARELHAAGGRVIVQSEASSEQPAMPKAAIEADAADLVVPLQGLAQMLVDVANGTPRPRLRSELEALETVFAGTGPACGQLRAIDWSQTALGPVRNWSQSLRNTVRIVLASRIPMSLFWGPQCVTIANDACLLSLGEIGPVQGRPARAAWQDAWQFLGPEVSQVMHSGEAMRHDDQLWSLRRRGFLEEIYFTYSLSPLQDDDGVVAGVLWNVSETTVRVLAERRLKMLRTLGESAVGAANTQEACARAVAALADAPKDLPLALIYLIDPSRNRANLAATTGLQDGATAPPQGIDLRGGDLRLWPISRALQEGAPVAVDDLATLLPGLGNGVEPLRAAMVLPLRPVTGEPPVGVLILGFNPRLLADERCRDFFNLVAARIAASLADARTREGERGRRDELAGIERAKTEFFANVSHEFRTPLTLLLAPLQDILRRPERLPDAIGREIEVASRNGRRLLGLVNDLLDFSQSEARSQGALLEAMDLGAITRDVASAFRSAIEAAGVRFRVCADAAMQPVPVNREMWERVVSNLLSNAFKFTFDGEIAVTLRALSLHAELIIADTGIGISSDELPHIFKRFHRVRDARARTAEGAGIGLAIVEDLVKRMGGQLRVRSQQGRGTAFTIWMPYKSARAGANASCASLHESAGSAAELAREASRWANGASDEAPADVCADLLEPPQFTASAASQRQKRGRIVIANDNADMRRYLQRLLATRWDVEAVADGAAGLAAIKRATPELILADVRMLRLHGFALLQRIREDLQLRHTPFVLLIAHADEETAIKGLLIGADDCIAKPFSPRELIARIQAAIDRAHAAQALQACHEELERFSKAAVVRERQMIALKKQINTLKRQLDAPPRHRLAFESCEEKDDT